jgi:sugar phosphate isomerase/epimerase
MKISLAEASLYREIRDGRLDHLDFADMARNVFGIEAVEYVNTYFKNASAEYIRQTKQRAEDAGVKSLLIMCDAEGELGDPDKRKRMQAVENHYKWVDAAKVLGCHSVRVNARSAGSAEEQAALTADGFSKLLAYAAPLGINVIVENHGGLSSNGAWLAGVIKRVNHPMCGSLPDFGNWRVSESEQYDPYTGVQELMPFAKAVSAKSYNFDAAGNETTLDYARLIAIVRNSRYSGYVGIEFEGPDTCEKGIWATKKLLERILCA